jgi:hypothetical protein
MPPPAEIYSRFASQVASQVDDCRQLQAANRGLDQRTWREPSDWLGNVYGIADFARPYDRLEMNVDYPDFFLDEDGRVADAMAAKLQAEHLSVQERAFRQRHSSGIRAGMHAAVRRRGHGADGGLFVRTLEHVQDVILSRNAGD